MFKIKKIYFIAIEANKIEQAYAQRYQQVQNNDFVTTSYDTGTLPKNYGLSSSLYDDVIFWPFNNQKKNK